MMKNEKETFFFLVDLLIVACRKIQKKEQLEFVKKKVHTELFVQMTVYSSSSPNDSVFQL